MQANGKSVAVIGAGPAGLMAAEVLAGAGVAVSVYEAKPTVARKFLMAGKSGLNLTKAEDPAAFRAAYGASADWLGPMLDAFGPDQVQDWARGLGQPLFTGSTGRVFPEAMKASPLLRAWMQRLQDLPVTVHTRWRWTGWQDDALAFDTPQGPRHVAAQVVILALGGASWARLGSDGLWADVLRARGVEPAPFEPSNAGLRVGWSAHMAPHFGSPVKGVALHAGARISRGEVVLSARGIEGGGIYTLTPALRQGQGLMLDLLPDMSRAEVAGRLARPRGKASLSNHIRKVLNLSAVKRALLQEFARPLPSAPEALAARIKALPVVHAGVAPLDEAISTSGGVPRDALTGDLMIRTLPGVFCAGEMLDWDAPTGGYLLTACLATGRWAARGALAWLRA